MLNVKFGRWKNFSPQATDIALGYYGRTPAPIDLEVQKIAAQKSGKDPITVRPADLKDPGMEALRKALAVKDLPTDDEHCVIQAMFPQELDAYYKSKDKPSSAPQAATPAAAATPAPEKRETIELSDSARHYNIAVKGKTYSVAVEEV